VGDVQHHAITTPLNLDPRLSPHTWSCSMLCTQRCHTLRNECLHSRCTPTLPGFGCLQCGPAQAQTHVAALLLRGASVMAHLTVAPQWGALKHPLMPRAVPLNIHVSVITLTWNKDPSVSTCSPNPYTGWANSRISSSWSSLICMIRMCIQRGARPKSPQPYNRCELVPAQHGSQLPHVRMDPALPTWTPPFAAAARCALRTRCTSPS
jgi:hypothetical protein